MRDLFEAIEQLSTLLAMRLEKAARKRGWATRADTRLHAPNGHARGRMVHLVSTTLNLPQGHAATFVPRPEAEGEAWPIDVRRSDGVMRRSWADGLRVVRAGPNFVLWYRDGVLRDEAIESLMDDLARPGPSGVAQWVRKVWAIRFGRMPVDLSDLLESVRDADRLDRMHAALLRATDESDAVQQVQQIAQG
jgi:hypothetical protein